MQINSARINLAIDQFIHIINKGPFRYLNNEDCNKKESEYILKKLKDEYDNIYQCAVAQAWLDMCRTTDGDEDNAIKGYFSDKLKVVFEGKDSLKLEDLIYCTEEPANKLTVGQRQKIVNMACKYLYCCEDLRTNKEFKEIFDSVDMPLDSFILDWFYRVVVTWCEANKRVFPEDKPFAKGRMCEWSKLNEANSSSETFTINGKTYYSYSFYQKTIKDYINDNIDSEIELSPLEIEFVIWPEILLLVATESFIFSVNIFSVSDKKEIRDKHSIKSNIELITRFIESDQSNLLWFE